MHSRELALLLLLVATTASLADDATTWPCFHGPGRDNISVEKDLLRGWPEEGPPLLWTASGLGHGYSTVAIAADRIFTAGMIDKQTYVTALDMTGKVLWQKVNGQSWEATARQPWAVPYSGSRGTPTVCDDTVYHLSELGRLTAFDLRTGDQSWHVDVLQTFGAERPKYGLSESVLIHGDSLFCCPGGEFVVRKIWKSELLDNHHGGVLLVDGHLYGAGHEARGWFCLDFATGDKRWQADGKGALTFAEGMLYCLNERGTMSLVKATPEKWDEISSFRLPRGGKGLYWAHPVVHGRRLYVRHSEKLFAYDVRKN